MERTLENLVKAFIGESQARNRYSRYAKVARKEGYEQIAEIFEITAENEREHAKWLMTMIQELLKKSNKSMSSMKVEVEAPLVIGDTIQNLQAAIEGEHYENAEMYPEFARVAEEEGLKDVAERLRAIAKAEEHHEERYRKLLELVREGKFFKRDEEVVWVCRKCGYVHVGSEPPAKCPSCEHPYNYFQVRCEEF